MKGSAVIKKEFFELDLTNGFLPAQDPLQTLPKQFQELEEISREFPKLLSSGNIRKIIHKMSPIHLSDITNQTELERLMVILSYMGQGYVWGESKPVTTLPKIIAQPWYEVATKLGRHPILSYASYALQNWRRLDPNQEIVLGNIVLLQNFLGGVDEEWFILVHVNIEAKAAPALQALMQAQQAVQANNSDLLVAALKVLKESLTDICNILDRMPEHCDPYIYYHRVRPYIHGWRNNPSLPGGLVYEGVEAYANKPMDFLGETGAQSSIIPSIDAVLGVHHKDDPLMVYLRQMREYMPPAHRAFIAKLEENKPVREYVIKHYRETPDLREYYNESVKLVSRFRTTHLRYAAQYIQKQSQTSLANPTEVGTGGTPFIPYLSKHRGETDDSLI